MKQPAPVKKQPEQTEADIAEHQASLDQAAETAKAEIEEHALADRTEIDDQAAADRAAIDAEREAARPEAEKVSPEAVLLRRLHIVRHARDQALTASRQLDVFRLGQAVHELADLIHEMMSEPASRPAEVMVKDPLEHERVGHPKKK